MEVFNRATRDISKHRGDVATVTVNRTYFTFSGEAAQRFGITVDKFVEFVLFDYKWFFIITKDPAGYPLHLPGYAKPTFTPRCTAQKVVKRFREIVKQPTGSLRYFINETSSEHKGCTMYEILTHKPIDKLGK